MCYKLFYPVMHVVNGFHKKFGVRLINLFSDYLVEIIFTDIILD